MSIKISNENTFEHFHTELDVNNKSDLSIDDINKNEKIINIDEGKLKKDVANLIFNFAKEVKNTQKPILTEPEIKNPDIKDILKSLEVDNDNDIYDNIKIENLGFFNFTSDDMMKLINLIVKYLVSMIKKFEASREMGVILMNVELNLADLIGEGLNKKANIMIGAAITSAGISMTIHGMGAFVSMKGMGKDLIGHSNPTMLTGNVITSTADPLARVADQTLQSKSIVLDGKQKVLEARGSINNHVINNNNEIQREMAEIIKALLQAFEAIIHNQQDTAAAIATNTKG